MKTTLLFLLLFLFYKNSFAQEQDYKLSLLLGQKFQDPIDFSIAHNDYIYVLDILNVKVFSPEGELLKEHFLDSMYSGYGITADEQGHFYVVSEDKVCKYTFEGDLVMCFGSKGSAPGQFDSPKGIDLDAEGNIYIADSGNHRIQKFDKDGNFLFTFGSYGSGPEYMNRPHRIKIDADNKIYLLQQHQLQRLILMEH